MTSGSFRFDRFVLDPGDRRLSRDGRRWSSTPAISTPWPCWSREPGKLVSKDRFLDEVWSGVPVTDEALTQCIKTLRRQLGDDAAQPALHRDRAQARLSLHRAGRRRTGDGAGAAAPRRPRRAPALWLAAASSCSAAPGRSAAGVAGVIGGLFYGFAGAAQPLEPGMGAASVLLVLLWLTIAAALIGGAGVALRDRRRGLRLAAACGSMAGGALRRAGRRRGRQAARPRRVQPAARPLAGRHHRRGRGRAARRRGRPRRLAGEPRRAPPSLRRGIAVAGLAGGAAGMLIPLLGGRLMGGSLDLLARPSRTRACGSIRSARCSARAASGRSARS